MMMKHYLLPLAIGWAIAGCSFNDPCDEGQNSSHGLCYPIVPDAGAPPSDGDGGSIDAGAFAHFGEACTGNEGCILPTDLCAILPGQSDGYCTRTDCLDDPSVCPVDWSCFDVSGFDPTLSSICLRP